MIVPGIVLIKHKIFNPEKGTTKVFILKIQLVYCVLGIQICFLSTRQIIQSELRVEGNKSSFTFQNKPSNAILSANFIWNNIQIVKTCIFIFKHNISNSINLTTRYQDFETLYHHFQHISDKVICHIFENIEDMKKIYFPTQKYISCSYTLKKMHQYNFSKNPVHSSKPHN